MRPFRFWRNNSGNRWAQNPMGKNGPWADILTWKTAIAQGMNTTLGLLTSAAATVLIPFRNSRPSRGVGPAAWGSCPGSCRGSLRSAVARAAFVTRLRGNNEYPSHALGNRVSGTDDDHIPRGSTSSSAAIEFGETARPDGLEHLGQPVGDNRRPVAIHGQRINQKLAQAVGRFIKDQGVGRVAVDSETMRRFLPLLRSGKPAK